MAPIRKIGTTDINDIDPINGILSNELFSSNPIQTILVDKHGKITDFNKEEQFSLNGKPRIGEIMYIDYDPNHEIDLHKELLNCIEKEKNSEYLERKDNGQVHSIYISPIENGAIVNIQDITERINIKMALLESEARYNALYNRTLYLIFICDLHGRFIDANDAALALFGYTREELYSINFTKIAEVDSIENLYEALDDIVNNNIPNKHYEIRLKKKDNSPFWINCEGSAIYRNDKPFAVQVIARDITRRKEAESSLDESEEKYKNLFENINTGICRNTGGPHGSFIHANPALAKMLGFDSVEELTKLKVSEIYQNPRDRKKFVDSIAKSGTVRRKELNLKKKNGTSIIASCTAKAYYDDNNEVKWMDILVEDITRQKMAEKKLKQSFNELRKTLSSTVQAMAMAIESRDPYTAGHQRRVSDLAFSIASELGLSNDGIDGIRLSGLIHDLGKITIPAEILSKPSLLSDIEFELIKNHCQIGYDILKSIEFPWPVAQIVYQHHERLDGTGYPRGLDSDNILMEAKIIAVSDVVEAMATNRPYRACLGIKEALNEIQENKCILYDPDVVNSCLKIFNKKGFTFQE